MLTEYRIVAEPIALSLQENLNTSAKSVQIFTGSRFLGGILILLILRNLKVTRLTLCGGVNSESELVPNSRLPSDVSYKSSAGAWFISTFVWEKY